MVRLFQLLNAADIVRVDGYEVDDMCLGADGVMQVRANGGDDRWNFKDQDITDFSAGSFSAVVLTEGAEPNTVYFEVLVVRVMQLSDLEAP